MIVLDTHALFWWLNEDNEKLSPKAKAAIAVEEADGQILVSSMSAWELALLVAANRLEVSVDVATWVQAASEIDAIRFVPVDNQIAIDSISLTGLHRDPADRIIVATARRYDVPLVTKDRRLLAYPHVRTIW